MTIGARVLTRALDLAFPASCAGCSREGKAICGSCATALDARLDLPAGTPIGMPADLPPALVQVEWCAPFAGVVRKALHQLKYAGERRLAVPLGAAMARRWAAAGAGGDLFVPVPVHRDREKERGYDQAVLLAEVAAGELGLPMDVALERWQATAAQFDLDRKDRAANVANAFRLRARGNPTRLRGRWIVLVDDVHTTGATLSACAETLMSSGVVAVSAITVARER